jgi:hypothetical protein
MEVIFSTPSIYTKDLNKINKEYVDNYENEYKISDIKNDDFFPYSEYPS